MILLTGVDPDAMATTMVGLQFDLPRTVAVRHHIDVERQVLTRVVSDPTGVLERHEVLLDHACVTCAIREDILPTLARLARDPRWSSIVAHLPVGAAATHLCAVLQRDTRLARWLRVSAVITAADAGDAVRDLLGDDLLADRGRHCSSDDRRSVGEVLAAMVEYADAVVTVGDSEPGSGLLRALARPGVPVTEGTAGLDTAALTGRTFHVHSASEAWVHPARGVPVPTYGTEGVWQLDLRADRPVHPDRLLDGIERLGGHPVRSRGCLWLATRPGRIVAWDGAGGQLSIGDHGAWGRAVPFTRIVSTGVGVPPAGLVEAFESILVSADEGGVGPQRVEDGLEPWLGPIRDVA